MNGKDNNLCAQEKSMHYFLGLEGHCIVAQAPVAYIFYRTNCSNSIQSEKNKTAVAHCGLSQHCVADIATGIL